MGPFHQDCDGCSRISWDDFRTEGPLYCDGHVLKPRGLMGQITLFMDEAEATQGDCAKEEEAK